MAKYLVTGGCGFIGSQLTKKLLTQDHEVIIVDDLSNGRIIHPQATLVEQDITQLEHLQELFIGIDGCFHLAAIPSVNMDFVQWLFFHKTNLNGSLNVFKSAVDAGCVPVVYASSCGVYGDKNRFPLTEGQSLKPRSSYGCDKLSTELNANFLAQTYRLPTMGLRLFNVYGPYQHVSSPYSGVITNFITHLFDNKPITIYGDGTQTRDFVFVEDVVDHLIHAMKTLKERAHVVNICTGSMITMNELAALLSNLSGKQAIIDYQPARQYDAKRSYGSPKKIKAYGFKANHNLRQGLAKTLDYFRSIDPQDL